MKEGDKQLVAMYGNLRRYEFNNLPDDLQEEIIDLIDAGRLTFGQAQKMCSERNNSISGESIRRFYNALRLERQKTETRNAWLRAADILQEMGADKMFDSFIAFMMGHLISGVEAGNIDFPVKDFMKLLGDIPAAFQRLQNQQPNGTGKGTIDVTPEKKLKIRQEIYGL